MNLPTAVVYDYYTTLKGVMEKEDSSNPEFVVPAKLKELYEAKDFGPYANCKGELPVAFLANCDITGGNSGSPMMNSRGELIGLAFDGNWELCRAISPSSRMYSVLSAWTFAMCSS